MKVKIGLSAVLVAVILCCTSCIGNGAYSAYKKSLSNYARSKQAEISTEMILEMDASGQDVTTVTYAKVKSVTEDDAPIMSMSMSMDFFDQQRSMKMYYEDGYLYIDYLGEKTKSKITGEEAIEKFYLTQFEINKKYILESSNEKTEEGSTLYFLINSDIPNKAIENQIAAISGNFGLESEDVELGDVRLTAFIDKKKNLKKTILEFEATLNFDDTKIPFKYKVISDILSTKGVIVDRLEDEDTYIEAR